MKCCKNKNEQKLKLIFIGNVNHFFIIFMLTLLLVSLLQLWYQKADKYIELNPNNTFWLSLWFEHKWNRQVKMCNLFIILGARYSFLFFFFYSYSKSTELPISLGLIMLKSHIFWFNEKKWQKALKRWIWFDLNV